MIAKTKDELLANPAYRACKACGEPVHHKNKRCKECSAPSPWIASNEPPPLPAGDPQMPGRPIDAMARTTREYIAMLDDLGVDTADLVQVASELDKIAAKPSNYAVEKAKEALRGPEPDVLDDAVVAVETGAHVFMAKFTTQIGATMCHFPQGRVIEDFVLLGQLKALNAPMIPVTMTKGMVCCPQCNTIFPAKTAESNQRRFALNRAG